MHCKEKRGKKRGGTKKKEEGGDTESMFDEKDLDTFFKDKSKVGKRISGGVKKEKGEEGGGRACVFGNAYMC